MRHQARLFFVALQFLTRVPVPAWVGFEPAWLNACARYFPLVGAAVGGVAGGVFWATSAVWPAGVAAVLSIGATLLVTGAFHEDGLADTADALGGAVGRERALEIMKDSRIGSYGAVALVVVLGLKASALAAMLPALAVPASIFAHAASRAVPVMLIRRLAYAGDLDHAKAKPLAQRVGGRDLAIALATVGVLGLGAVVFAPVYFWTVVASVVGILILTAAASAWLRKRLGGYTGDTLGATQQVAEVLILLVWLGAARWPLA